MPYFRIFLHGTGICVPVGSDPPLAGFYTTRHVSATSAEEASQIAKAVVLSEWTNGSRAQANQGGIPHLTVESLTEIAQSEVSQAKDTGYMFYSADDNAEATR